MDQELIANRILNIVSEIAPETRYEERAWFDGEVRVPGINEMLRIALSGQQVDWCDVVFESRTVWIEVKHSWTWHTYRNPGGRNTNYRDHLFGEKDTSALRDVRDKLPCLIGRPGVATVGFLLIALDSVALPHSLDDIAKLEKLAGLAVEPWSRYSRARRLSAELGYKSIGVQPFLWLRSAC